MSDTLKDLGNNETVKGLVTAVLTAGFLEGLENYPTLGVLADSPALNDKLVYNLNEQTGRSLIGTGVNGGDFGQALEAALLVGAVDSVHAQAANNIKSLSTHLRLSASLR